MMDSHVLNDQDISDDCFFFLEIVLITQQQQISRSIKASFRPANLATYWLLAWDLLQRSGVFLP